MDKKSQLIKNCEAFATLPDSDIAVLAAHSEIYLYNKGELLFNRGSKSRHFFILEKGEIAISNHKEIKSEEDVLARFLEGELIGEFEFFEEETRSSNAIVVEDSSLLVFPRQDADLEQLMEEYAHIFAKAYHVLIAINAHRMRQTHKLISEKSSWLNEIKKQMFFDKLTGVYNRTYLEDELSQNFSQLGAVFSVIVIKPDNFKLINDTFGHEIGDSALQAISEKIKSLLDVDEQAIRFRGNEFVVLLAETDLRKAQEKAEQYLQALNSFDIGMKIGNQSLFQTFSLGISMYPEHDQDLMQLVEKAFARVFHQRELGGNGIQIANKGEDQVYDFLRSVAIFSNLTLSEMHQLSGYLKPLTLNGNDCICRANDPGDELFIVETGSISIQIPMPERTFKEIAVISSGDFFGEMAIFENAPRSATCIAVNESKIFSLHKKDFFSLMKKSPGTAIKIMKNMLDITSARVNASGKFIAQMVKLGQEASRRAVTDKLTGVYNRRFLESELANIYQEASQNKKSFALIMADMDYFREVNEGYSHEIGDQYIIEVAKVFQQYFRKNDVIARYGGDEFTILLPEINAQEAAVIAEQVRLKVGELGFLDQFEGPDLNLSVSLGMSLFPDSTQDLKELTRLADEALYKAKNAGRNRLVVNK